MALERVELTTRNATAPDPVRSLITDGEERIREFMDRSSEISAFVPSDFGAVYQALAVVRDEHLASGDTFCEWGSGFGVVACLAALLGFDACGIEIEPELVERADQLAEDHGISVQFACGTIIPGGLDDVLDMTNESEFVSGGGADGYAELDIEPDELDVVFGFPWPGEAEAIERLFDRCAAIGALLVTYNGLDDVTVRRKVR